MQVHEVQEQDQQLSNTESGSVIEQKVRVYPQVEEYGPEFGFRPSTPLHPAPIFFLLNAGGMGDYINYAAALKWIAERAPWVHGTVFISPFLIEFLEYIFKPYPHWKIRSGDHIKLESDICFMGPEIQMPTHLANHQLLNATGAHLMDLGFAYYANMNTAPADWTLPFAEFPENKVHAELRGQTGKYVVITPGAVTVARYVTGEHLNPIIRHVKSLGLLPVFLGKDEVSKFVKPMFADDIAFDEGLDLRNKTTVCQAAAIMERAACVLGLDNGLLHLAACTKANVIFGYNITSVKHREPRRRWGRLINISLTDEELACSGCQSKMKLLVNHTFHRCLYSDSKCIDLLFADGAKRWCDAIDEMLAGGGCAETV